jgi:hypothetical protein
MIVREGEIAKVPITHLEIGRSNLSLIMHTRDKLVRVLETKVAVPAQRHSLQEVPDDVDVLPDSQLILAGSEDAE